MINATNSELEFIEKTIRKHLPHCEIRLFGSRIKGTARHYSDIDVAIVADKKLEWLLIDKIKEEFAESDLIYRVDLLDFNAISESFRKVIEENYKVLKSDKTQKPGEHISD